MAVEENDAKQWLPDRYFSEVCNGLNQVGASRERRN